MEKCDFCWALAQMADGKAVRREGWQSFNSIRRVKYHDDSVDVILLTNGKPTPLIWNPRQADVIAEDWQVVS